MGLHFCYAVANLATHLLVNADLRSRHFDRPLLVNIHVGDSHAGPYAILRHSGYAHGYLLSVSMPLSLGSLWALIPAVLLCLLLVLRTIWEDRTLREELAGCEEYTWRVPYRLIPGVW